MNTLGSTTYELLYSIGTTSVMNISMSWPCSELSADWKKVTSRSLDWPARDINTQESSSRGNSAVLVFNPLAWKRAENGEVHVQFPRPAKTIAASNARGSIPVQVLSRVPGSNQFIVLLPVEVPSLGYSTYHLSGEAAVNHSRSMDDVTGKGTTLENRRVRVTVDPKTGCITSLYDKRAGFEAIAKNSCGNELQAFHDNWSSPGQHPPFSQIPKAVL